MNANSKKRDLGEKFEVNSIYLNFTTPEENGLLLWTSTDGNQKEFLGIGIENEKMKFVWSWEGYNTTVVTPNKIVADGVWHDLTIDFELSNVTIWMDGRLVFVSNETHETDHQLSTNGIFFLGGFPETNEISNKTHNYFTAGFKGCLQQVKWGTDLPVYNFTKFTGENIRTCDPFGIT